MSSTFWSFGSGLGSRSVLEAVQFHVKLGGDLPKRVSVSFQFFFEPTPGLGSFWFLLNIRMLKMPGAELSDSLT